MFSATYTSGDLGPISIDIIGEFLNQLSENASILASLLVVIIVIGLVFSLLKSIFSVGMLIKPEVNEEETVEKLPERNEYQATLECNNCKHEQKIPIVKGYDIEEAIGLGDYFCKICGSKKLKRKRPYWE
jgi:hypothetical protein